MRLIEQSCEPDMVVHGFGEYLTGDYEYSGSRGVYAGIHIPAAGESRLFSQAASSPDSCTYSLSIRRCDVPAHNYQLPWAANPDWTEFYAEAPEIQVRML